MTDPTVNYYRSGRRKEGAVSRELEAAGWRTIRATLSRGPADIVALQHGRMPLLVQVKSGKLGLRPVERNALVDMAHEAGGRPILALYARGGAISYFEYHGYGARDRKPAEGIL